MSGYLQYAALSGCLQLAADGKVIHVIACEGEPGKGCVLEGAPAASLHRISRMAEYR